MRLAETIRQTGQEQPRPAARALQSATMRKHGLGWIAEACPDPVACELHLCVADHAGRHWHPVDPLAFAKWRVRALADAMPAHVAVRIAARQGWLTLKRGILLGTVGLGSTAAALALWLALHGDRPQAETAAP